jgi:hypothetical protein
MTEAAQSDILAGIYRRVGKTNELLAMLGSALARAGIIPASPASAPAAAPLRVAVPEQGELPLAGCVLKCRPRIWGSTVNFYNEAWMLFKSNAFILAELFDHREELTRATHGKVHLASFQRVLSALVRAGAATRKGGAYTLREPNDELREAVERVRNQKGGAK